MSKSKENPQKYITVNGAKVHNLKDINVQIPKNKMVVMTGVSGSGKSSLAFDTIFAEGQRRYVESLSSYARQFLEIMEKPDVETISGLSPAISIDQKTVSGNPRSTVGTITEINDYLRLLFARVGTPHCPNCRREVEAQSIQQITDNIINKLSNKDNDRTKLQLLAPIVKSRKGQYKDLFENLLSKGFIRVRVDGEIRHLEEEIKLERYEKHSIDIVVDRLVYDKNANREEKEEFQKRLVDSAETATNQSDGEIIVLIEDEEHFYSENNSCPVCNLSFAKIEPHTFSFNSPHGACPKCGGIGTIKSIDEKSIYNPSLTILEGGIFPWSNMTTSDTWTLAKLRAVAKKHNFDLKTRIGDYPKKIFELLFYGKGSKDSYIVNYVNKKGKEKRHESGPFEGVIPNMNRRYKETSSEYSRKKIEKYMVEKDCPACEGKRLKPFSLAVRIKDKNINDLTQSSIGDLLDFLDKQKFTGNKKEIYRPIGKEIKTRLKFLKDVGLEYLTLNRKANTLSGGESQRIRLASQIGTGLTGVLYVLDEPSIGLHHRDMGRLLNTLEELRDLGNTVLVVEHDEETIRTADWVIDMGPGAGENGGEIVSEGTPEEIEKDPDSITGQYLDGEKSVVSSEKRIRGNGKTLEIFGASQFNLKDIDVEFPLNKLISVTGLSGSGKSTLVNETLYKVLVNEKQNGKQIPGEYHSIDGLEHIDKVVNIDQSPIGRTPRSNPATYTGIFTPIRELFAQTKEARARGYEKGRFSFNVKGGRCENCGGGGYIKVEMQFLPDMYITCEECKGKRYNRETLQIDYKDKNISEVLDMTVTEAREFFGKIPKIKRRLQTMIGVGLGYIRLGQPATTLSGGEAQRIKLATELSKMPRGHTIYLLDEPTTGLHFEDVKKLINVLHKLVDKGHTVVLIEHNIDVIRSSDWIIDLGPEGGDKGGEVVAEGTVKDIIKAENSYTGKALKKFES